MSLTPLAPLPWRHWWVIVQPYGTQPRQNERQETRSPPQKNRAPRRREKQKEDGDEIALRAELIIDSRLQRRL
jgi:hypothetical protein